MAIHSTFYIVSFIILLALPVSQRLLVLVGGVLGAGISYSYFKGSKRARTIVYVDFDNHPLVSIDDPDITCIFPKDNRCRQTITGPYQKQFVQHRESLLRCTTSDNLQTVLQANLPRMVELKLCKKCQENPHVKKCIEKYVEKWTTEVKQKLPMLGGVKLDVISGGNAVADNLSIGETPSQQPEKEEHPPGGYRGSPPAEPSPCVETGNRRRSSKRTHTSVSEDRSLSNLTDAPQTTPSYSLSPEVHQVPLSPTPSPRRRGRPPKAECKPVEPINGWQLVPHTTNDTIHDRIFQDLQKHEIASGFVYILSRETNKEYYKVGYTKQDVQSRLQEHIEKCKAKWKLVWWVEVKHAKRVEALIHLEFEAQRLRFKEIFCQTGGDSCTDQHKEIVKATLEEVKRCMQHWAEWMNRCDECDRCERCERYVERSKTQSPSQNRRTSNGAKQVTTRWSLAHCSVLKISDTDEEFCMMSTGKSWVKPTTYQPKNKARSVSTSAMTTTPKRPNLLQETREVQSEPCTKTTKSVPGSDVLDSTPSRRVSTAEKLHEIRNHENNDHSDTKGPNPHAMEEKESPQRRAAHSRDSSMDYEPKTEQPDLVDASGPVSLHAKSPNGARKCPCAASHTLPLVDEVKDGGHDERKDGDGSHRIDDREKPTKRTRTWTCQSCSHRNHFPITTCSNCQSRLEIVDLTLDSPGPTRRRRQRPQRQSSG